MVEFELEGDNASVENRIRQTHGSSHSLTSMGPRRYKPRVPNYLHELDLNGIGNVTFKDFAAQKNLTNNKERHLVAAFWLKEYGYSPTINIDKVYTCYRTVRWPTSQPDWDLNFRKHVLTNRFRRVIPGEYAINPLGEDDVRKMNGAE